MAQKKVICNVCGHESEIDAGKEFFFCPECGNKVAVKKTIPQTVTLNSETDTVKDTVTEKLKEVEFYYQLSFDKKEYEKTESDPTYYLKAQDLLVDLSTQFPDDYRIWWELCKPIDFICVSSGINTQNRHQINEDYFSKALDKAELSKKRELIDRHDAYIQNKEKAKKLAMEKALEEERRQREAEEAKRLAEEKKRNEEEKKRKEKEDAEKRALEEKRRAQEKQQKEEQLRREKEEAEERKKQEAARKALEAEREAVFKMSGELWNKLKNKDYSEIDNTIFSFSTENNQTIIGVFKSVSGILYLNSFRIDGNKSNVVFKEQSLAIQFDEAGCGIKFDKSPVKIKGFAPPDNLLRVFGISGSLFINSIPLKQDKEYIKRLSATSKKPIITLSKVFS